MHRFILIFLLTPLLSPAQELIIEKSIKFLALGDSYTVGQSVSENERWPNQLADSLRIRGCEVLELKNIAATGWTTGDLLLDLRKRNLSVDYNLVGLLIGVNNQFRGRSIEEYKTEFEELLRLAIQYADNEKSKVFVLSIPDYSFTLYGEISPNISDEIDLFNAENKAIADRYEVSYIEVTDISRRGVDDPDLIASDGLHPSGKMYGLWVERILEKMTFEEKTILHLSHNYPDHIYPNPATDFIQLEILIPPQKVSILSLEGTRHLSHFSTDGRIDISQLSAGTYILEYGDNQYLRRKLITKK